MVLRLCWVAYNIYIFINIYLGENCVIFNKIYNYDKQSLGEAYLSCFDIKRNVIRDGGVSLNLRFLIKNGMQDM